MHSLLEIGLNRCEALDVLIQFIEYIINNLTKFKKVIFL